MFKFNNNIYAANEKYCCCDKMFKIILLFVYIVLQI